MEEADESLFWLSFAKDLGLLREDKLELIIVEADQLVAIFTATRSTARKGQRQAKSYNAGSIARSSNISNH